MKIEKVKLVDLITDPKNARKHSKKNIEAIKESLKNFQQYRPLVVQKSTMKVAAGNGTMQAMIELGYDEAECIIKDMTDEETTALAIADNRTAELGKWDYDNLLGSFDELLSANTIDINITGFEDDEIAKLFDKFNAEELIQDNVYGVHDTPRTEVGDIYQLGNNRILCGDSTVIGEVNKLFVGTEKRVDCMVTDPPSVFGFKESSDQLYKSAFDNTPFEKENNIFIFVDDADLQALRMAMDDCTFELGQYLVWRKNRAKNSKTGDYKVKHRLIAHCWFNKHVFYGDNSNISILEYEMPKNELYPDMLPTALVGKLVNDGTSKNSPLIYDPFAGTGTTLIACEQIGKTCYCIEKEPALVDLIIQRYCDLKDINSDLVFQNKFA